MDNREIWFETGKTATETHEMLVRVSGDAALSRKTIQEYKWFERFRGHAESTEDEQRSSRPSTSPTDENVSNINEMIRGNRRLTILKISLNISFGSVQLKLTKNLIMIRVSAKFVPRPLSQKQKELRLLISLELRDRVNSDTVILRSLITGDES
jgi:hypothetical protein